MTENDTESSNTQASYISECFGIPLEKAREITKAIAAKKARKKR